MKKNIKQFLSCITVIIITLIMFNSVSNLLAEKKSVVKNHDFLNEEENFDVLFLGTSHVINGVYPMELWNDYGIVSYNLAGHSTPMPSTYWVLMNALDYTTPKLVVVDCMGIQVPEKVSINFDYTHLSFDIFPISPTKIKAAKDLLADNPEHTMSEILFPFSKYHNRWNQLTNEDFYVEHRCEKGAEMRIDVANPLSFEKIPSDSMLEEDTTSIAYLNIIIEECNNRGIDVLLTYLPFPAKDYYQAEANRLYQLSEEQNVNYINFLDMELVDYSTDCYDEDSHLNPSGARKVTDYLGQYITENYDIPDQRNNPDYTHWHNAYDTYKEFKTEKLTDLEDAYVYMMMLSDKNYNIIFEVTDNVILEDEKLRNLLKNLGIDCSKMAESEYVVLHNSTNQIDYIAKGNADTAVDTCIGSFHKNWYSDNNYKLCIDTKDYADISIADSAGIHMRTIVIDDTTRKCIENLYYMHIDDENVAVDTILIRAE